MRSQITVEGRSYMGAMLPNNSVVIMTSVGANISDPRVLPVGVARRFTFMETGPSVLVAAEIRGTGDSPHYKI